MMMHAPALAIEANLVKDYPEWLRKVESTWPDHKDADFTHRQNGNVFFRLPAIDSKANCPAAWFEKLGCGYVDKGLG